MKKPLSKLQEFYKKLTSVQGRLASAGVDFNDLTKEAVNIVWDENIGDISAVNKMLVVARDTRGFSDKALLMYFKECVPFTYNKDTAQFTKKNGQTADRLASVWEEFTSSKNWYDFESEKKEKAYKFEPEKLVSQVTKFLDKADENSALTLSNLLALQMEMNRVIEAKLSYEASDDSEANDDMDAEEKAAEPTPIALAS